MIVAEMGSQVKNRALCFCRGKQSMSTPKDPEDECRDSLEMGLQTILDNCNTCSDTPSFSGWSGLRKFIIDKISSLVH